MANRTIKNTESEINEEPIVDTEEVAIEEQKVKEPKKSSVVPKVNKKYSPNDLIECRSVTGGELILIGDKSKLQYSFADYGDTAWIEYQDLQALQSRRSGFLTKPRFIIEDKDLVEQWGSMLKPIYDKINTQSIDEFFALPLNKFKAQLKVMPEGLKDAVKTRAVQMIQDEELYDIRKVREIDEALGTDFVEMFLK